MLTVTMTSESYSIFLYSSKPVLDFWIEYLEQKKKRKGGHQITRAHHVLSHERLDWTVDGMWHVWAFSASLQADWSPEKPTSVFRYSI